MKPAIDYSILNILTDAVYVIGKDYTIVFANQAVAELYALPLDKIIGRKCFELSHSRLSPCETISPHGGCQFAEVFHTGRSLTITHLHTMPDGGKKVFDITTSPVKNDKGEVFQLVQILKDVTVITELREKALVNHLELKRIFDNVPNSIVYLNREMRVLQINHEMEKFTGIKFQQARGKFCYDLWGQYAQDETRIGEERICDGCQVKQSLQTGERHSFERQVGNRIVEIITIPVRDQNRIVGTMEIGHDITKRKMAERKLHFYADRMKALSMRLEEVEDTERKRLSSELHDGVGQNLTALGINLQIIRNDPGSSREESVRIRLDDSISLVEGVAEQVRFITTELRPPVLDDYGLLASLRLLGQQFSSRSGLRIEVGGDEAAPRFSLNKEKALYRVSREALTNVVKHAEARHVTIVLTRRNKVIHLEICDDGRGFDFKASKKTYSGLGLLGMQERVDAFQGSFVVVSEPGKGTKVLVEMPE